MNITQNVESIYNHSDKQKFSVSSKQRNVLFSRGELGWGGVLDLQVNFSVCLIGHHVMLVYDGEKPTAPSILKLCSR